MDLLKECSVVIYKLQIEELLIRLIKIDFFINKNRSIK
jgi:hypothetical protein